MVSCWKAWPGSHSHCPVPRGLWAWGPHGGFNEPLPLWGSAGPGVEFGPGCRLAMIAVVIKTKPLSFWKNIKATTKGGRTEACTQGSTVFIGSKAGTFPQRSGAGRSHHPRFQNCVSCSVPTPSVCDFCLHGASLLRKNCALSSQGPRASLGQKPSSELSCSSHAVPARSMCPKPAEGWDPVSAQDSVESPCPWVPPPPGQQCW